MKYLIIFLITMAIHPSITAQKNIYKSSKLKVSFYSSALIEDIEATSISKNGAAINFDNNKVFFKVDIKTFKFQNSLMQSHFNDNYMESDKYPYAKYQGLLNTDIPIGKDGTYETSTTGDLTIHGVTKKYTVPVKMVIKNGKVTGKATFNVKLEDHNIKIPSVMSKKIAETIKVSIDVDYEKL